MDAWHVVTLSVVQVWKLDCQGRLLQHVEVHHVVCWHIAEPRCTVVLLVDDHLKVVEWICRFPGKGGIFTRLDPVPGTFLI